MNINSFLSLIFTFILLSSCNTQKSLTDLFESYDAYSNSKSYSTSWPIVSQSQLDEDLEFYKEVRSKLNKLDLKSLNEEDVINVEMLKFIIEDKIFNIEYGTHMIPLNSEGGFIIGMLYNTRGKSLNSDEEIADYLTKLNTTSRYLVTQEQWLRKGIDSKIVRPKLVVKNCIQLLDDILSAEDLFVFKPLRDKKELDPKFETEIIKSFENFRSFLANEYLPKANEKIGIIENKNGKSFYEQRVRFNTTLELTPEDIYQTGLSEVKRIRNEMNTIIQSLDFEGSFEDFIAFLREDEQFYPKTEQEILYFASWLSKKAEEILPRYFGKLPRLPFTVTPVPASIAPNYTTGRYSGGSMSSKKAGQYWVNTYNLPSRPLYVLPALTLHEAVPGHHLQISLAKELKGLPQFRSFYLSAFGEGWGLYSEYLGQEAGIYTTPYEEFGRLTYEMWRACRLVVDPGMHYFGMSREEAVDFMKSNTSLTFHEINTEINRYIGWPGQAVSYKIGELKIRELRKKAEKELGDNFDIRAFHDLVLKNGSIPLVTLERIIDQYINKEKKDVEKN